MPENLSHHKTYKLIIISLTIILLIGGWMFFKNIVKDREYRTWKINLSEYFPFDQGNRWTYQFKLDGEEFKQVFKINGTETVDGVHTVRYTYSSDGKTVDGYKCLANGPLGIVKYKESSEGEYEIFNPPGIIIPNLKYKESKDYRAQYTQYDAQGNKMMTVHGVINVKWTAVEDVRVKAGVFKDCLKFEYFDKWEENSGDYDSINGAFWVAKGIGKVKEWTRIREYDAGEKEVSEERESAQLDSAVITNKRIGGDSR